jgi:hypothetical protein
MDCELIHRPMPRCANRTGRYPLSLLQFVKHAAFAGLGKTRPNLLWEIELRFFSKVYLLIPSFLGSGHFEKMSALTHDPTETAYLSNLIGRGFADYFSKKIHGAKFTHSYECAMRMKNPLAKISGKRPDFYCVSSNKQFAVEAKGYSKTRVTDAEMLIHLSQAKTSSTKSAANRLPVHFYSASVAHALYEAPIVKFWDELNPRLRSPSKRPARLAQIARPVENTVEYDETLNLKLRKQFYETVRELVEIISLPQGLSDKFKDYYVFELKQPTEFLHKILLHRIIVEEPFNQGSWLSNIDSIREDNYYIDVDGIGLIGRSFSS